VGDGALAGEDYRHWHVVFLDEGTGGELMATRIEQDAFAILKALVERQERRNVDAKDLAEQTSLDPDRLNDAVTLLVDSGLVEWIRVLGTDPYAFLSAGITPRGRYDYERIVAPEDDRGPVTSQGNAPAAFRQPTPVGSPFGFVDADWELVAGRKSDRGRLYVVMGFQFRSDHYDSDKLKDNVKQMFEEATNSYNALLGKTEVSLNFIPLTAGYGEHLFNQIARDIIGADIAVFETSDLNPNVMLEMGVALTWGVRVLPVRMEDRPAPPSDVSGQTWATYRNSAAEFCDRDHQANLVKMIQRAIQKK
jgi:hypothetical protein